MLSCGSNNRKGPLVTPFGSEFSSVDAQRLTAICAAILTVFVIVSSIGILVVVFKVRSIAVEVTNWVGPQTFADASLLLNATASAVQDLQIKRHNSLQTSSSPAEEKDRIDTYDIIRTVAYFLGNTSRIMHDLDMEAMNNLTSHLGSDDVYVEMEKWREVANRGLSDYEHMETYIDAMQKLLNSRN